MLVELSISSFAIIESLRLEFGPGFSVLTGETGAGKSIIIDAVSLLLGARASVEMIRTGCEIATVEGVFTLPSEAPDSLGELLQERGLLEDSSELILRREISRSRRNVCRVNGRAVTLSTLQEIGQHLIDIHGQGEHLSLLRVRNHLSFLDRYGGLVERRRAFGVLVQELRRARAELQGLRRDERELARRADLLAYQIGEIHSARLTPGEEEELKLQRSLLANAEKRMQLSAEVYALLYEGDEDRGSVTDLLGSVLSGLHALAECDPSLSEESGVVEEALYQLEELARTLRSYRDEVEYDPERLEATEERIDLIQRLRRKYGESIEEILRFAEESQAELDSISHSEERTEALLAREQALLKEIVASGKTLSEARRATAERLRDAVKSELADLNMGRAQFLVDLRWSEAGDGVQIDGKDYGFDVSGLDHVQFLIAPSPGEEPKPLVRIASGGEMSRLMLAMKSALSAIDPVPTLIFDEIDTGIGGRTGSVVGQKLWALANEHQVFCVTHRAQIAAYGQHHFRVAKEVAVGRTTSLAWPLSEEERVEELAVMLGGEATEATRRSADELLSKVAWAGDSVRQ